LENVNLKLQQEIGILNKNLNESYKSYSELQTSSNQIEKENESFKNQISTLTHQSSALQTKLSMTEKESIDIKSSCDELANQLSKKTDEIDNLNAQMKQEHHKRNIESSLDIQNINILNELIEYLRLDETHATYKYILEQCNNESHTVKYLLKRVSTLENSIIEFNRS
jgi:chromosome segregation ATPase